MNAYETVLSATYADDVPIGLQEWILQNDIVRSFTVQGYACPNCVRIQYQDGTHDTLPLADFKQAVNNA